MAEKSGPFESTGDGLEESDWIALETPMHPKSGYIANYLNELAVSQTAPNPGMSVDVATGAALVNTSRYINSATKTLTIAAAHSTQDRYDLIVVRRTLAAPNSTIALTVVQGDNYPAGTAVPKDPTIDATTWEISLATVSVAHTVTAITTAMISDQRDTDDCGKVYGLMGDWTIDSATGNLDGDSKNIQNIADPVNDQDAVTKKFVTNMLVCTEITGTTQQAAINTKYVANNGSLVTVTLPATAAVGDYVAITGAGAGKWKLAQNASQVINFQTAATTTGTGGYLLANHRYDAVVVRCIVTNTTWVVESSVGILDVI